MKKLLTLAIGLMLLCALSTTALAAELDWTSATELPAVSSSLDGTYYLSDDISLNSGSNITVNDGRTVNLNLNGYELTSDNTAITINSGGTLNLYDSAVGETSNGTGTIKGGSYVNSSTVSVNGGTFNMYGGTISSSNGGTNSIDGGGVYVSNSGIFTMYDGTITDNDASVGGGVYVNSGATFNMSGGTITDNSADNGNDVYVGSGATFTMSGGTIPDGGIVFGSLTFTSGTDISNDFYTWNGSTLTLLKDLTIYADGIYLTNGGTIDLDGHTLTITTTGNTTTGIDSAGNLIIKGTGTLNITSANNGIVANTNYNISIKNVTVNITADGTGINTNGASITLNNVIATIDAGSKGLDASGGNLTISGASNIDITATTDGIYVGNGDIAISDSANVTINADDNGINAKAFVDGSNDGTANINITTSGTVDITSSGKGIYAEVYEGNTSGTANINITDAAVDITSSSHGIYTAVYYLNTTGTGNITISGSADVNVKTTGNGANGIEASGTGNITISDFADVTVNAKGNNADGIRANGNNIKITTTGKVTTYAAGSGINTGSDDGSITITNATVVNTSVSSINSPAIAINGTATVSSTSKLAVGYGLDTGTFTLDETVTLNAVVALQSNATTMDYTVYGDVVVTSTLQGNDLFNGLNELNFKENSKLTINQGVALSLVSYSASSDDRDTTSGSIDWNNANVINNGVIYLNDKEYANGTAIADLGITGDGYIALMTGTWDNGYNYATSGVYHNDGTDVAYVANNDNNEYDETLELDTTSVTGNEYYSWTVVDGAGTLTVNNDFVFNSGLEIKDVDSVNIIANGKITIAGCGVDDNLIATGTGDLTITGDLVVTGYIDITGDLTVDGNLVAGAVFADSMEVPTGSTVNLLGAEFDDSNCLDDGKLYALRLSDADKNPALTLGDVDILTAGVSYSAAKYENNYDDNDCYIGTFINEGETPDFSISWYNIASAVSIGIPSSSAGSSVASTYSSSVASTENGTVTISGSKNKMNTTVTITATPDDGYQVESVTVTYASGREISVTDKGDGVYTYLQPGAAVAVTVTFVAAEDVTEEVVEEVVEEAIFTDVDADAYYYQAMMWAVENGITTGYADDTFRPSDPCSRAQVVTFLWRAMGEPDWDICYPYADVDADAWYVDAVYWATVNGITAGYADETFRGDNTCTRGAIVTFLYRLAGEPDVAGEEIPSDVAEDAYYYNAVLWAVENGITTGYTDGTFGPDDTFTRGQIVTFLYRYLG